MPSLAELHPRHWPFWIALGLLRLLVLLPWPLRLGIGRRLGLAGWQLLPRRRHIARVNLRLCFPERSEEEREQLARQSFAALGMGVVETASGWWRPLAPLRERVRVTGLEHLQAALAGGKGVILLGAHFTTLDFSGALFSLFFDFDLVYRKQNQPLVDRWLLHHRRRFAGETIERNDIRTMVRRLRAGRVVWIAADQDAGPRQGVFAPFFGIDAATHTSVARLAQLSGAPVLFGSMYRTSAAGHYWLDLQPAFAGYPSGNAVADASRMNRAVEEAIRRHPEQYFWLHRRFKTQADTKGALYR